MISLQKRFYLLLTLLLSCYNCFAEAVDSGNAKTIMAPTLTAGTMLQTIFGLILVLGCIVLVVWLLKKTNSYHSSANGQLKIIAGVALGPREKAMLVQVGDTQVLIGVTPQHVQTLHVLDKPVTDDDSSVEGHKLADFADKLKQAIQHRGNT